MPLDFAHTTHFSGSPYVFRAYLTRAARPGNCPICHCSGFVPPHFVFQKPMPVRTLNLICQSSALTCLVGSVIIMSQTSLVLFRFCKRAPASVPMPSPCTGLVHLFVGGCLLDKIKESSLANGRVIDFLTAAIFRALNFNRCFAENDSAFGLGIFFFFLAMWAGV